MAGSTEGLFVDKYCHKYKRDLTGRNIELLQVTNVPESRHLQKGLPHPIIGTLSRPDSVLMPARSSLEEFMEDTGSIIHLTVTRRCYARCEGCINRATASAYDEEVLSTLLASDADPEREAALITQLARRYPGQGITIAFYGGEPFLAADKMEQIRFILRHSEMSPRIRFMVYTNGELLADNLRRFPELMTTMWLYSVSIDGDAGQHGQVRPGTDLARIEANLRELRAFYQGSIVLWSTLREQQSLLNCFDQFMRLYEDRQVNHFFWHWADLQEPYRDFQAYAMNYARELQQIMDVYVQYCREGAILPIVHLNELILYLISGRHRDHTACGVELARNLDIVDGGVCACADLPAACGSIDLKDTDRTIHSRLSSLTEYKEALGCYQCGVHPYCGGRCPVQALLGSWNRTLQTCQLMRLHVALVTERLGGIRDGLTRNGISLQDIYDHSAYLAPYLDVTP